ncbi:ABC transporter ATP-binding protein [Anaerocolumna xylanovorans]|uniref:Putative ABC transport system ATP-binding protein n=1 Tax=Anaerocolumna xylanovorans DSM 12503 TaxID=1121345 RepID=A0A1M7YI82_9FIRM|nr:ABC transporter ATP-binding protein [Anaerocolumna xylanovorans]SHO52335.1 putative ABC transport system ATP-binding protein [Anaerocolumna xylanovorans DSM 12503]
MFLTIKNVSKSYGKDASYTKVLDGVDISIASGERCIILGPSGSGKSTLLNVIGGLDEVESGEIIIDDVDITKLNDKKLVEYRREYLGFIFQFYNLVPNLTVRENIMVCENLAKKPLDIRELIKILGLEEHQYKFPSQLSGGQQQRCAIARAIIKNPKILLCDEPTGALDSKTAKDILILLENINKNYGTTIIMVTHNTPIKDMMDRVIHIKNGKISNEYVNKAVLPAVEIDL